MTGDRISVKPCDINIKKILQLTDKMIELAEIGDAEREDTGCGILYGVLLDSAYKLKRLAEKEKENHINKGWWKNDIE
jgi:sulfopyruvate decarboxylase TPP-binding subunit